MVRASLGMLVGAAAALSAIRFLQKKGIDLSTNGLWTGLVEELNGRLSGEGDGAATGDHGNRGPRQEGTKRIQGFRERGRVW